MPTFFENFENGKANVRQISKEFGELVLSKDTIEVDEDNFDVVLEQGAMYQVVADENVASSEIKEYYAERYNEDMKKYIEVYNKNVDEHNEQHKDDEEFEPIEHKEFVEKTPEEMVYEFDSSYVTINSDGSLNYVPFNTIFHKQNTHKHDVLGVMLYEYVVENNFDMEDAIEVVLL